MKFLKRGASGEKNKWNATCGFTKVFLPRGIQLKKEIVDFILINNNNKIQREQRKMYSLLASLTSSVLSILSDRSYLSIEML